VKVEQPTKRGKIEKEEENDREKRESDKRKIKTSASSLLNNSGNLSL